MVAGVGVSRACTEAEVVAVVRAAGGPVGLLAAPDWARGGVIEGAAAVLGVDVVWVERAALEAVQGRCVTRSAVAARAVGVASVAEGCALAVGGRLVRPRIALGRATCALASA